MVEPLNTRPLAPREDGEGGHAPLEKVPRRLAHKPGNPDIQFEGDLSHEWPLRPKRTECRGAHDEANPGKEGILGLE